MYSARGTRALPRVSFLIRRSRGQRSVSTSPELIAAAHVLLRLLAPRHPPCALSLLIVKNSYLLVWSFQGARGNASAQQRTFPVSQNSAANDVVPEGTVEVDVDLGELGSLTARAVE